VVRAGAGWFGNERNGRHAWTWSEGRSRLEVEAWPRGTPALRLRFFLRGQGTGQLVARENGREIWRGEFRRELRPFEINVPLRQGRADLDFVTDLPAAREGPWPGARALAFALYDPKIEFPP